MARVHPSNVKEVASNKPASSATAFNLPDSATAPFRSFDSALATGDTVPVHATNGTAWMDFIGTFTAGSPDTLAQTTLLDSSTGSFIDWSAGGDVTLEVAWLGKYGENFDRFRSSYIYGCNLLYNSGTAFKVTAGRIAIDDTVLEVSETTLTSATTWVDLSGAAETIAADTLYFVYAYNNAGAIAWRVEPRTGSGNGADPELDANRNYWKAPTGVSTPEKYRCIGALRTYPASATLCDFIETGKSNDRTHVNVATTAALRVLSAVTAAGSASLANFHPVFATDIFLKLHAKGDSASDGVVRFYAGTQNTAVSAEFQISVWTNTSGALAMGALSSAWRGTTLYYDGLFTSPHTIWYGWLDYMGQRVTI